ncbi:iron-containing alcohol dehydrogenase [Alkalihalobacillus sp. MEB130]|uniref:iron-containing alcohol dehydrogenase n=1 Tax=Alkalihalobacillus sp. MEB130 TaxID=2976704 RepID=UPI0028DD67B2|nr:iron-containing alcohol dehydrogenase [Alkalihalobacillus sp. MEB130]MDT8858908.1 iron-containing alcohol dehydrogenase [Alkalihalobacillus sp. MEB130]
MNQLHQFQTAKRIVLGDGVIKNIGDQLGMFEGTKHVLLVTSPSVIRNKHIEVIGEQLDQLSISYQVINDITPEPTVEQIESIQEQLSEESFDLMIGIGGGSVLDATKLFSVLQTNKIPLKEMIGIEKVPQKGIPMILIPTTSGTGSEVTPNSIVTIPEEELKVGIVSRHFLPDLVLLDPSLTITLPKKVTAATGMDAFTHAFESFISNKANPISDMYALESMRLISGSVIQAYEDGSNLQARQDMLLGSVYGGMALTSAGTAAVHALAYPLGGKFHIAHGEANSMLLPHVTQFNLDHIEDRMATIARTIGIADQTVSAHDAANRLIEQIVEWTKALNIPQDLKEFGVKKEDVPALAEAASKVTRLMNNNPKKATVSDIEKIYERLL